MDTNQLRVNTTELAGPKLQKLQQIGTGAAVIGGLLAAVGYLLDRSPARFFEAYLHAYMFWISVTVGSLGLLMLHHVVGGGWGFLIRRLLEAASRLILPMALLFIPIALTLVLNIPALYSAEFGHGHHGWAHPEAVNDHILKQKSGYLNVPFFLGRTVLYFLIWGAFSRFFNRWGATQDERADVAISERLNVRGGLGMLIHVLISTFVAVDWVMSLTPHWFSSIFGLLFVGSQALSTLALMLVLLSFIAGDQPLLRGIPDGYFRDLGNLLLAMVMLWAYLGFSQYLINYSGNLVEEVPWWTARAHGGWQWISIALVALHFALPFGVLLIGSNIKKDPRRLAGVALFILVMRFVDQFWLIAPTFRDQVSVSPADFGTPLLIGGIWLVLWVNQMKDRPVVPLHDPRLQGYWTLHPEAKHG